MFFFKFYFLKRKKNTRTGSSWTGTNDNGPSRWKQSKIIKWKLISIWNLRFAFLNCLLSLLPDCFYSSTAAVIRRRHIDDSWFRYVHMQTRPNKVEEVRFWNPAVWIVCKFWLFCVFDLSHQWKCRNDSMVFSCRQQVTSLYCNAQQVGRTVNHRVNNTSHMSWSWQGDKNNCL